MAFPSIRRISAVLLVALAVVLPVAVSGCGDSSSDKSATELVSTAFRKPIKSADLKLQVDVNVKGAEQLQGPVKLKLEGPFESGGKTKIPSLDWDLSASASGQSFSAGLVSTGDNAFVKFQGTNYEVGKAVVSQLNSQLQQANQRDQGRSLSDFGVNAKGWLKDAKKEGDEDVAGESTTHIAGSFDVGRFLDDLNQIVSRAASVSGQRAQRLTDEQKKQFQDVLKDPKIDVYVSNDDDTLRRLSTDLTFEVPQAQRSRAGGAEGGTLSFTLEFGGVGEDKKFAAPAGAKPISELSGQLGGLGALGALGGGAGALPGGSTGGQSGGSPKQKYDNCIKQLGGKTDAQTKTFCEAAAGGGK